MARLKAKNMAGTTLTADITNTATSFGVANASLLPDCPFRVTIYSPDPQVTAYEIVEVGAKDDVANTVSSVQRGLEGTTATAHSAGAYVEVKWTAEMYNELETEAGAQAKADAVNNALLSHKNDTATQLALKADKAQENWIPATLQNGWINLQTAKFFKDTLGNVHVRGRIEGGTTTAATTLFTFPVGYRPDEYSYAIGATYSTSSDAVPCVLALSVYGIFRIVFDVKETIIFNFTFRAEN